MTNINDYTLSDIIISSNIDPIIYLPVEEYINSKNNVEDVTSFNFYTNTQEKIELSNKNPIEINLNEKNRPKPYITVRRNLKALISRSVYYEMIDSAQETMIENKKCLALSSNNNYFKLYEL